MIIGVTGSLATGKSTAAKYLADYLKGYLIDADKLAHFTLSEKSAVYKSITSNFGREILSKKGRIDRAKLAKKAFSKKANLKKLCDIIHPITITKIKTAIKRIYKKRGSAFIVIDAPVLIEAGFYKECDYLVVVTSSLIIQLERAEYRKNLKLEESLSRIKLQMPLHKKVRYADYIVDNNGSLKELRQKCKRLAQKIKKSRRREGKW